MSAPSNNAREEFLWETTRDYFADLAPEVEDAAYRCAIVRWFNPEVLTALLSNGQLAELGRPFKRDGARNAAALCTELQRLPFIEDYPGRGFNYHDLTRQTILKHLWRAEPEFYHQVSALAADYFGKGFQTETGADWGEVIEWAYHSLIAKEDHAIDFIGTILQDLGGKGHIGLCHALVQVAEEQAAAERLATENLAVVRMWRIYVSYMAGNYAQTIALARALVAAPDETTPPWIKAQTTSYLADSLRINGQYHQAYASYQENLERYEQMESADGVARSLVGLGNACYALDNFQDAEKFYKQALEVITPTLVVQPEPATTAPQAEQPAEATPAPAPTVPAESVEEPAPNAPSIEIRLHDPESWHTLGYPSTNEPKAESTESTESAPPQVEGEMIYGIEIVPPESTTPAPEGETPVNVLPVRISESLANIWLQLGTLYHTVGNYDAAAACGRLAGQMYSFLNDTFNTQRALRLLYSIGAVRGDLKMMESGVDYQRQILDIARQQGDSRAELEALLGLGASMLNTSQYAAAHEHYTAALELARTMEDIGSEATAMDGLARLSWIAEDSQTAEGQFKHALQLYIETNYKEGQANLNLSLGDLEMGRNRLTQAGEYYRTALELYRELKVSIGQCDAWRGLATIAQNEGRYPDAIQYLQDAVTLAHNVHVPSVEATCLSALANVHRLCQNREEAEKIYQQALALMRQINQPTGEAGLLLALGDLAIDQGAIDQAAEYFQAARKIYRELKQPVDELNALVGLLNVSRKRADAPAFAQTADEASALVHALTDRSEQIAGFVRLAENLRYNDAVDRAWQLLNEGLALQPDNASLLRTQGDMLSDMGEYQAAAEVLEHATRIDPMNSRGFGAKGWALENLGAARAEESAQAYQAGIDLNPTDLWMHKGLANALRLQGKQEEARAKYEWVIEQAESRSDRTNRDWYLMGWCHFCLGNYDQAVPLVRQALALDATSISTQFDLAVSLMGNQQYAEALEEYQRGLELVNRKPALARRGLLVVARDDLLETIAHNPGLENVSEAQQALALLKAALAEAMAQAPAVALNST